MSRTFRHKTNKSVERKWWFTTKFCWVSEHGNGWYRCKLTGNELTQAEMRFHRDGEYRRDKLMVQVCDTDRAAKMRNKQELAKWMKDPDYEVLSWEFKDLCGMARW